MTETAADLEDIAELRDDRLRAIAAIESGECRCPDEPHQNLLHSLVYDMGTLFTDLDYLDARFQVLKDQESRLRAERDAWKARAEAAEAKLTAVSALPVKWRNKRHFLMAPPNRIALTVLDACVSDLDVALTGDVVAR